MNAMPLHPKRRLLAPVWLSLLIGMAAVPGFASPLFTPSLTISEEYTDNVYGDATGERDDFITVVSPGIRIDLAEARYQARLAYSPGFTFHHREADDNSVRHNADALFSAQVSPQTEVTVTDRFVRTNEPRTTGADPEVYAEWIDPTLRRGRKTWYSNTAAVSVQHRFGQADSFGVGYRHSLLENDDPLLEDNQRHTPWARLSYWFNPTVGLDTDLSYERGVFDAVDGASDDLQQYQGTVKAIHRLDPHFQWFVRYTHTQTAYDGLTPDYSTYDPGLGFSWTLAQDTVLDMDVGYYWQARDGADEESGLSFKGSLATRWGTRFSLRLFAESGYEEASYGAESLGLDIYHQGRVAIAYQATRELSFTADGGYRYNEYADSQPRRQDDVYDTSIGLGYKPAAWRWLSLALTGRRHDVQSSVADNDVTENSVMFSVSLSPVTPYRWGR